MCLGGFNECNRIRIKNEQLHIGCFCTACVITYSLLHGACCSSNSYPGVCLLHCMSYGVLYRSVVYSHRHCSTQMFTSCSFHPVNLPDIDHKVKRSAWNSWRGLSGRICDKKVSRLMKNELYVLQNCHQINID